jgi:hypothetical protein
VSPCSSDGADGFSKSMAVERSGAFLLFGFEDIARALSRDFELGLQWLRGGRVERKYFGMKETLDFLENTGDLLTKFIALANHLTRCHNCSDCNEVRHIEAGQLKSHPVNFDRMPRPSRMQKEISEYANSDDILKFLTFSEL